MNTQFFDLHEVVSKDEILVMLSWKDTTLHEQLKLKDDPFMWHRGIHFFQVQRNGKLTFNKRMIQIWLTAKSQNDPHMHLDAIALYQALVPRISQIQRRKRAV